MRNTCYYAMNQYLLDEMKSFSTYITKYTPYASGLRNNHGNILFDFHNQLFNTTAGERSFTIKRLVQDDSY